MNRVTAGDSFSFTYDVGSSGEPYTAKVTDAQGRYMTATTSESAPNVTVSVDEGQWVDGASGHGWLEIRREDTNAVVKRDRFRIMGGLSAGRDYQEGYV